jgi:putative flippase GtrA
MIKKNLSNQFLIFLITGGIAALVNFGSRLALSSYFNFSTSIIIAYIIGMIVAYILSRKFVFIGSQQALKMSVIYFTLVNVVAIIQTWLISMYFAYYLLPYFDIVGHSLEISHAAGVIFPVFTSYLGHKYLSFK